MSPDGGPFPPELLFYMAFLATTLLYLMLVVRNEGKLPLERWRRWRAERRARRAADDIARRNDQEPRHAPGPWG